MSDHAPLPPLGVRRHDVQQRVAAQRAAIAAAWRDVDSSAARVEAKMRRAVAWTRRASGVAMAMAAWWAVSRLPRAGVVRQALGLVAAVRSVSRLFARGGSR